jgi:hypothetical protein
MTESSENDPPNLIDFITPETDEKGLREIVQQFITPEDEEVLGGKEEATKKVAESVAYLGVFIPLPATFDEEAYQTVICSGLSNDEGQRLFEISRRMGAIQDAGQGFNGVDIFSITPELKNFAESQFLDEE